MFPEKATMAETGGALVTLVRETLPAHRLRYHALLVFITMIWGSTFLVVKNTIRVSGPFTYLAFAYGVGALAVALIFRRRLARITRAELRNGLITRWYDRRQAGVALYQVSRSPPGCHSERSEESHPRLEILRCAQNDSLE